MESGKLRRQLYIQSPTETRASDGGVTISWATVETVWGSVVPVKAQEFFQAQAVQSNITHKIRIRYYSGLTTKYRLKDVASGAVFNIGSIIDAGLRQIYQDIMAIEVS